MMGTTNEKVRKDKKDSGLSDRLRSRSITIIWWSLLLVAFVPMLLYLFPWHPLVVSRPWFTATALEFLLVILIFIGYPPRLLRRPLFLFYSLVVLAKMRLTHRQTALLRRSEGVDLALTWVEMILMVVALRIVQICEGTNAGVVPAVTTLIWLAIVMGYWVVINRQTVKSSLRELGGRENADAKHLAKEYTRRLASTKSFIYGDCCLWIVLAFITPPPDGMIVMGLFFVTAVPFMEDYFAPSSTKVRVTPVAAFHRLARDSRAWVTLLSASFAGALQMGFSSAEPDSLFRILQVVADQFFLWAQGIFPGMTVLQLPTHQDRTQGIFQGLLSISLFVVVAWREAERLMNRQYNLLREEQKAKEASALAEALRLEANESETSAIAAANEALKQREIAEHAHAIADEAMVNERDIKEALESVVHNLKNEAWDSQRYDLPVIEESCGNGVADRIAAILGGVRAAWFAAKGDGCRVKVTPILDERSSLACFSRPWLEGFLERIVQHAVESNGQEGVPEYKLHDGATALIGDQSITAVIGKSIRWNTKTNKWGINVEQGGEIDREAAWALLRLGVGEMLRNAIRHQYDIGQDGNEPATPYICVTIHEEDGQILITVVNPAPVYDIDEFTEMIDDKTSGGRQSLLQLRDRLNVRWELIPDEETLTVTSVLGIPIGSASEVEE